MQQLLTTASEVSKGVSVSYAGGAVPLIDESECGYRTTKLAELFWVTGLKECWQNPRVIVAKVQSLPFWTFDDQKFAEMLA